MYCGTVSISVHASEVVPARWCYILLICGTIPVLANNFARRHDRILYIQPILYRHHRHLVTAFQELVYCLLVIFERYTFSDVITVSDI